MNKLISSSKLFFKRNSSTMLTVAGATGVVGTTVLAIKATPKALKLLEDAKKEKGEDLTKLEIVRIAGPAYIPTVAVGVSTIACIFGANVLNKRQQAALVSAYALLDSSYKEYKGKVKELYGEEAEAQIKEELAKDKYDKTDISLDDGMELFYDEFSGRYFESTKAKVQFAEYQVNRDIHMQGWSDINTYYGWLDIDPIEGGDAIGWSEGGNLARYWQGWIDFNHHKVVLDDGLECTIVGIFQEPYPNFEDDC